MRGAVRSVGRIFRGPGWLDVTAAGVLPGGLLGAHVAGLLFFINPDLPFSPAPVLRGIAIYGGSLALISLLIQLPFLRGRPRRARRWLPWGVTAALVAAATLDGIHASVFAYFLPPGINVRLIKTAAWLSVAALVAFYTALLHSLYRRPYGARSRAGFVLLILFSLYIMVERREAFEPAAAPPPLASVAESEGKGGLVVVGLGGASLDALLPLAEQGHLPFVGRMLQEGAHGRLASLSPNRPDALWATLASGKYPYKHRVLGGASYPAGFLAPGARLRLLPMGIGFSSWGLFGSTPQPGTRKGEASRLWEILPRAGISSGVVGWPGSSPPSLSEGPVFSIGERFFTRQGDPSAASPADIGSRARLFRVRPEELDPVTLAPFGVDPPRVVLEALAEDRWRVSLARFLAQGERAPRALFVFLPGLERVSREFFGGYAKAQFEGAQHRDYLRALDMVTRYHTAVDGFLDELWAGRDEGDLLVVASAYGVEEAGGWRRVVNALAGGRPLEGHADRSPDGVLLLLGEGVAAGTRLDSASLVDLVPTVAYGLGLPIARDLDGKILTEAFDRDFLANHPLTFVPSYETLAAGGRGFAQAP